MHEVEFSQAALPAPVQVLGLTLRPYSLAHELFLIREGLPWSLHHIGKVNELQMISTLPTAVLICAQTYSEIRGMNTDRLIGLKMKLWRRRLHRFDEKIEMAKFVKYQDAGALDFPGEPPTRISQGRECGAPFLLRLHQFVWLELGKGEINAWDYPFGLAKMRYAAACEQNGTWLVRGPFEVEYEKSRDEWMAANPGSTLKEASNA